MGSTGIEKGRDLGWLWHALAGLVIGIFAVVIHFPVSAQVVVGVALLYAGVQRERAQHHWPPPWQLSPHQLAEGVSWGAGFALSCLTGNLLL